MLYSVCDMKHQELVVEGPLEVSKRTTHLNPGMSRTHPEKLWRQFLDLMAEDNGHPLYGMLYFVFMRTEATPLCWYAVMAWD